jgi:hypothetical protein
VKIYDVNGILRKSVFFTENTQIDMRDQAAGVYIVSFGNTTKKILIK